jgi:transcriptional regulator with XRE-family HTH domain
MAKDAPDPLMARLLTLFEESRLTLDELGQKMGYTGLTTRASAWQFLNRTNDPRLSMLRKFAAAVGVPIAELFTEETRKKMVPQKIRKAVTVTAFYRSGKLIDDADEQRRFGRKATRTITKHVESGETSGEFEVEDSVICKWREE